MARSQETTLVLAILAVVVALLLLGSVSMTVMSGGMMGGGMMGGQGGGGSINVAGLVLTVFLAFALIIILVMLLTSRKEERVVTLPSPGMTSYAALQPAPVPATGFQAADDEQSRNLRMQEATIVKLLDEDERRLYTIIREKGGEMLQKDIVASGSFSKAKVTRLLDKLEGKGIVVRERHGMTNKIRLVTVPPRASRPA